MGRQPDVEDWGLSVGSKIMWLKNDSTKFPYLDAEGKPAIDKVTGMNGSLSTSPFP